MNSFHLILGICGSDKFPFPGNEIGVINQIKRSVTNDVHSKDNGGCIIGKEDTLWTVFHRLKAVFDIPIEDPPSAGSNQTSDGAINQPGTGRASRSVGARVHHEIRYDDSKRVVDMTEIIPNLFIGDE